MFKVINQTRKYQIEVQIRWMIRCDMPEVTEIEDRCFEFAWDEDDFVCCLRQRNCIGMVAEYQERIVGFMIYELRKYQLHVLNFAVHPDWVRCGVGSQMVDKLVRKLSQQLRHEIILEVRESNLPALYFFKAQGFSPHCVLRGYYEDTTEDAYEMRYYLDRAEGQTFVYSQDNTSLKKVLYNGVNRIAGLFKNAG